MRSFLARAVVLFLAAALSASYVMDLIGATWLNCYGTHPLCAAGWWPRTWMTALYLAVIAGLVALVRWSARLGR
jgi:hypothetical protein